MKTIPQDKVIDKERLLQTISASRTSVRSLALPLTKEQATDFLDTFYKSEVTRYGNVYKPTNNLKKSISAIADFLTSGSNKWGLYIAGDIGCGKTTLVKALSSLTSYLMREDYMQHNELYSECFQFVDAYDVIRKFTDSRDDYYKLFDRKNIIIDDVGIEPMEVTLYGMPYHPMIDLLMKRYANHRFTVITSNLGAKKFQEKYKDMRLTDRLKEMFEVISFNDKSFR